MLGCDKTDSEQLSGSGVVQDDGAKEFCRSTAQNPDSHSRREATESQILRTLLCSGKGRLEEVEETIFLSSTGQFQHPTENFFVYCITLIPRILRK